MTVIAIWHEDSPTTESFDMQMWASTAQKIGPGTTLEAEESTYKNEIDRNMKIHEGMYFPCNVPPSFCTSQNCLDFLVLTKIGLKRIRIKWCERFSDFNRMWGKNLQNFKRFITEKKPDYYFLWNCRNSRKKSAEVKPQKIGLKREKSFEDNRALLLIFHSLVFQLFFKEVAKKWCKGNVN